MSKRIRNIVRHILADSWYVLNKYCFEYKALDGTWQYQEREAYDRGNGATVLLYNPFSKKVILTQQFRMPTYVNGNLDGLMIEACAGLLDGDDPYSCIIREVEEETGYRVKEVRKLFEVYMSPGSVTEMIHFFIAPYTDEDKVSEGGGLAHEQENIEVLEMPFDAAYNKIQSGEINDAKTIMLLQYAKLQNLLAE